MGLTYDMLCKIVLEQLLSSELAAT